MSNKIYGDLWVGGSIESVGNTIVDGDMVMVGGFFSPGSAKEISQITTVADTALAPLNSTYLNYYSAEDVTHYVLWFNNLDLPGTDPMIPGTTSIEVDYNTLDADTTIAIALGNAFGSIDITMFQVSGNVVTVTNPLYGSSTDTTDGAAPTGFTFVTTQQGSSPSPTTTGTTGTLRWDANFLYVCVATNHWKRVALSDF